MLVYKLFYFCCISAMSITPFIGLYFKHLGMSASDIGKLTAARPISVAISQPLIGYLTDKWQCPKSTVVIGGTIWIGSALVMGIIIPLPEQKPCELIQEDFQQNQKQANCVLPYQQVIGSSDGLLVRKSRKSSSLNLTRNKSLEEDYDNQCDSLNPTLTEDQSWIYTTESLKSVFYILLVSHSLFGLGYNPLHSIADAESVNTLQELDIDMAEYGKQRAFGSLGWGIAYVDNYNFFNVFVLVCFLLLWLQSSCECKKIVSVTF